MDDDMKARKQQLDQDYFDLKTRKETDIKTKSRVFAKSIMQNIITLTLFLTSRAYSSTEIPPIISQPNL